jgi:hypothetical protein
MTATIKTPRLVDGQVVPNNVHHPPKHPHLPSWDNLPLVQGMTVPSMNLIRTVVARPYLAAMDCLPSPSITSTINNSSHNKINMTVISQRQSVARLSP